MRIICFGTGLFLLSGTSVCVVFVPVAASASAARDVKGKLPCGGKKQPNSGWAAVRTTGAVLYSLSNQLAYKVA